MSDHLFTDGSGRICFQAPNCVPSGPAAVPPQAADVFSWRRLFPQAVLWQKARAADLRSALVATLGSGAVANLLPCHQEQPEVSLNGYIGFHSSGRSGSLSRTPPTARSLLEELLTGPSLIRSSMELIL